MSRSAKNWLRAAAALVVAGALIFLAAFAMLGFDPTKISTQKYETNTYELEEDFENIRLDVATAKVTLIPSQDGACRIECLEREKEKHSVSVENDTLVIETVDTRAWYECIFDLDFGNAAVKVYLPQAEYDKLRMSTAIGEVVIWEGLSFRDINIICDTGDIRCDASAAERIDAQTAVGDIRLNGIEPAGELRAQTDTGEITLTDVKCGKLTAESGLGSIHLKDVVAEGEFSAQTDTGDVELDGCDGASVSIRTNVGDVTGTLLTEKIIFAESAIGSVDVPRSTVGGRCEISTDTGDIKISLKAEPLP